MIDILCQCGLPKSHHLVDFSGLIGAKLDDSIFDIVCDLFELQQNKYNCYCFEYKQDNLSYLEAKATEREREEQSK